MFVFLEEKLIVATGFIGLSVVSPLKCISMNNQECKIIMNNLL